MAGDGQPSSDYPERSEGHWDQQRHQHTGALVLEQAHPLDLSFLFQLRSRRTTRGHFDGLELAAERGHQQHGGGERGQRQGYRRGDPASSWFAHQGLTVAGLRSEAPTRGCGGVAGRRASAACAPFWVDLKVMPV